jgi:hypothetical protein
VRDLSVSQAGIRNVRFGDFTIQHPTFEDNEGDFRNFSASIRYATPEYWVVIRGEGVYNEDGAGFDQWPGQALLLTARTEFAGREFSWGDAYIESMGQQTQKTGTAKTWLAAAVNHHITLTATQAANALAMEPAAGSVESR